MNKIGLSVSFCIRDMVMGKVNPADVSKIIAGTAIRTQVDFEKVVTAYRDVYWRGSNPDACEALFCEFWDAGKIEQPRVIDGRCPFIADGWWIDSEDQINWS